ncbi:MAG: glycosyl transferase, partial [Collinsella sp.]|nr:glycosyl transferase [Collinsella sp.]
DEDCADERLTTLWSDLKAYDERMYRRARYGVVGFFTNLHGRAGDKTTLGLYRLASKIFKFN